MKTRTGVFVTIIALTVSAGLGAQTANVTGTWEGTMTAGPQEFRLVLHIKRSSSGALTATIDSIDQNAYSVPVTSISLKDSRLSLTIDWIHASYEGELATDGKSIHGTWAEGRQFPLTFARATQTAEAKRKAARPSRGPYPDWKTSRYVLPYPAGKSYRVWQGNFYGGHLTILGGAFRYSYDFAMPIGSVIVAARSGRVTYTRTHFKDGNGGAPVGSDNVVLIDHLDGTYALHGHLTFEGALVKVGDFVRQGQPIALSGNTGHTAGVPHLHFMVSKCPGGAIPCGRDRTSIPVTFRNTRPNPHGLQTGETYQAYAAGKVPR